MKTEYTLVINDYNKPGYAEFIKEVNKKIAEGWKCQGGVSMAYHESMRGGFDCRLAQAMIKEVE